MDQDNMLISLIGMHKDLHKRLQLQKIRLKTLKSEYEQLNNKRRDQLRISSNNEQPQRKASKSPKHKKSPIKTKQINNSPSPLKESKPFVIHTAQYEQIAQNIEKIQNKLKLQQNELSKRHHLSLSSLSFTSSLINQDQIINNLNEKLYQQQQKLFKNIDCKIDIQIKIELLKQIKKRIKNNQEAIFKAKSNPFMENQIRNVNGKNANNSSIYHSNRNVNKSIFL